MDKSFLYQIKNFFRVNSPYRFTRLFAIKMFPLSFLVGLFICVAIPASYYFVRKGDLKNQASIHAKYLASIFKEVVETSPETWEDNIKEYIAHTNIGFVKIYDRNHNLISEIFSSNFSPHDPFIMAEEEALFAGKTYAFVRAGISLAKTKREALGLLAYSSFAGTFIGILLFLLPILEISRMEKKVNESRQQLLREQEKLRLSEEKYKALFEFAPDGIVISTADGKIVSWNQSFLQIFNLTNKEASLLNKKDLYANPEERDQIIEELFEQGHVQNKEVTFKRKDGTKIPALVSLKLMSCPMVGEEICAENEGQQLFIETIIRDISEQKKIEQQLIQAQKMESIGILAGGVAHDFNNLLAGILGYAELIKIQCDPNSSIYRYVEMIERSATRASDLTQKLLAFARKSEFKLEPVNLNEIVNEVVDILSHTIERTITIQKELDPNLSLVEADPSQITQALLNICVNARDAMPTGGIIKIKTFNTYLKETFFPTGDWSKPGKYVAVAVSDTGIGMDEQTKQHIFDPFFTTKGKKKGTGLGLSMAYGIVKKHGGYIDVESSPGKGSTFTIYLPVPEKIHPKTISKEEVKEEKTTSKAKGTILLIDDEEIVRELGKEFLEKNGYRVLLANDGEEGISVYQAHKDEIDLVLLDMVMPKKSGTEVFKELKSINPHVKVIIATGYSIGNQVQDLLRQGAKGFIQKPYRLNELLKAIRNASEDK